MVAPSYGTQLLAAPSYGTQLLVALRSDILREPVHLKFPGFSNKHMIGLNGREQLTLSHRQGRLTVLRFASPKVKIYTTRSILCFCGFSAFPRSYQHRSTV